MRLHSQMGRTGEVGVRSNESGRNIVGGVDWRVEGRRAGDVLTTQVKDLRVEGRMRNFD